MSHEIFISYANHDQDIVGKLKQKFESYGVTAWIYKYDRGLGTNIWEEIESKIKAAQMVIFVISNESHESGGLKREIDVCEKLEKGKMLPIFLKGTKVENAPNGLRNINGEFLNGNIDTVVFNITKTAFPSLLKTNSEKTWHYPLPGDWLEVSNIDQVIEQYNFTIGDKLYFRAISPMGLFECYSPRLETLFWILPQNVKASIDVENDQTLVRDVPREFRI